MILYNYTYGGILAQFRAIFKNLHSFNKIWKVKCNLKCKSASHVYCVPEIMPLFFNDFSQYLMVNSSNDAKLIFIKWGTFI